jgi:pimeloyl-ACP methyl ester carboxylesterase
MTEDVSFTTGGLRISAALDLPAGFASGERRPAVFILHGFGSNRNSGFCKLAARFLNGLGYVTLRFDMPGCGDSEGERGRVICLDQVQAARDAVTFLEGRPEVQADRIAVLGHSFGAAVAVYAAGVEPRIAACMSCGGWGDGEKKFRAQHASPEAWEKFSALMAEGRRRLARGESMKVSRFDVVPVKKELHGNFAPGSIFEFPYEVVESMYGFRAIDVVAKIAPRPLLLVHPAHDTVTPSQQSIDLFMQAGQPADLHLIAGADHWILSDDDPLVMGVLREWIARHLPLVQRDKAAA